MFVDTDILIWGLKQNAKAVALLDSLETIRISAVVCMELLQGARDKHDLNIIKQSLQDVGVIVVPIKALCGCARA